MDWSELQRAVRRDVLERAKAGQRHPDAAVAAAAYAWAEAQPRAGVARVLDVAGEVLSGVLTPGSASLGDIRERLGARDVAALGPPPQSDG